jgi:DNA-binding IclR family transcriptional regulator
MPTHKKDYSVPSLEKAITILNKLSQAEHLSISEIHTQLKLPKSTTFVILNTLERYRLIEKKADGKYSLGQGIFMLGVAYFRQIDIRRIAKPFMNDLVRGTPYTCHLAVLLNNQPVYVDKSEGNGFVRFATSIGQSLPLHMSGVGKALAIGMSDELIEQLITDTMLPLTDKSYRSVKVALDDIRFAQENGYSVEDEQMEEGIRCIGAPIYGPAGEVAAAISITALSKDLPFIKIQQVGNQVKETAEGISREMGYVRTV